MRCAAFRRLPPLAVLTLGGCAMNGAPSFPVVGAYFPAWMICGLIGVAVAVVLRVMFVITGVDAVLSLRLFTYVALGTVAALLVWMVVFGP
ncbi:hypothetical protein AA103196_1347 [Ameyamaea chiangmaiensis NBRC 103196]|uniref:Uncharacterized protein YtcA n=1 Tax=Ameyamaea chiangmaiensis TaxID=442969 RepID=A0A850P6G7_9PROT|nr:YtcA family lipoprotein [Ameyamaea chiangmaiensis]MBS4075169.1 hypothetical protein [Ameyamaea chiangmaiensis]NVN40217.1 hypothetical protein [Ameyamaea chiangmaiensis]GBQ66297.1 hypothetical protein AA103196_1347 [Ameyamaea chiangmaiensis NBRC 103196]